jgi:hypothetical protein
MSKWYAIWVSLQSFFELLFDAVYLSQQVATNSLCLQTVSQQSESPTHDTATTPHAFFVIPLAFGIADGGPYLFYFCICIPTMIAICKISTFRVSPKAIE